MSAPLPQQCASSGLTHSQRVGADGDVANEYVAAAAAAVVVVVAVAAAAAAAGIAACAFALARTEVRDDCA